MNSNQKSGYAIEPATSQIVAKTKATTTTRTRCRHTTRHLLCSPFFGSSPPVSRISRIGASRQLGDEPLGVLTNFCHAASETVVVASQIRFAAIVADFPYRPYHAVQEAQNFVDIGLLGLAVEILHNGFVCENMMGYLIPDWLVDAVELLFVWRKRLPQFAQVLYSRLP